MEGLCDAADIKRGNGIDSVAVIKCSIAVVGSQSLGFFL